MTMIFIINIIKNVLFSVKIVAGLMGAIGVVDSINCLILNFQHHNAACLQYLSKTPSSSLSYVDVRLSTKYL